jgi:hypothetical protein
MVGMTMGVFLATHIYSTQNRRTVLRLESIHAVAESYFEGLFGEDQEAAMSFILHESDLSLREEENEF